MDDRWTALTAVRDLMARTGRDGAALPGGRTPLRTWLRRVCETATQAVPADGAAVSLAADGSVASVAASSGRVAESLGIVQFSLGEGPCVDVSAVGHPILVPELASVSGARWPAFTPAAQALGVRAIFAFPLQVGVVQLGALSLHRFAPGSLDGRGTSLALAFATVTVEALLDAQAGGPDPAVDGLAGPDDALGAHYVVYQAQGMTMVDLGVSLADALARLRAHAFAEGRPLHEIAQDVVDGRLRLEPDAS